MKGTLILLWMTMLAALVLPSAMASDFDLKTIVTFSQSVEIPGMVLPAGKYVFKLLDTVADRNIVQIFNADEEHLYATILAITEERTEPADEPEFQLRERIACGPATDPTLSPFFFFGNDP